MSKYRVLVSPAANDRMYDHFLFLAQIVKDISSLENMPQRNPYFDRSYLEQGKYRYMLSCRRYRIVYQVIKDCVFVEDIQDCRQDNDKNLL